MQQKIKYLDKQLTRRVAPNWVLVLSEPELQQL
jgi:hypothetical protein